MSTGDIKTLQDSHTTVPIEIIGTCPCLRIEEGETYCINGDTISDVDNIEVHPDLIARANRAIRSEIEEGLPVCYGCIQIDSESGQVQCVSRSIPIKIQNRKLEAIELKQALEMFPKDRHFNDQDICASCLYKILSATYEKSHHGNVTSA